METHSDTSSMIHRIVRMLRMVDHITPIKVMVKCVTRRIISSVRFVKIGMLVKYATINYPDCDLKTIKNMRSMTHTNSSSAAYIFSGGNVPGQIWMLNEIMI
jgi:hypothetical protein